MELCVSTEQRLVKLSEVIDRAIRVVVVKATKSGSSTETIRKELVADFAAKYLDCEGTVQTIDGKLCWAWNRQGPFRGKITTIFVPLLETEQG